MHHAAHNPAGSPAAIDRGELDLINHRDQIDALVARITAALDRHHYAEPSRFAVRLALEEAVSNAFRHGHQNLPTTTPIHIDYRIAPDDLTITVADKGPGFDPDSIPDPTLDENLERPSGRGIMLMRAYMTRVEFHEPGSTVTLHYRRPRP